MSACKSSRYLEIEPWNIVERGFHPDRARVSEAIFSLANEFMGVRAFFDEGYSGDSLVGSYLNGVYDEHPLSYPVLLRGFPKRTHFMVSSVNWLYTRICVGGETLDLASSKFTDFERSLDLRNGLLTRSFTWHTRQGEQLKVRFTRFLSMVDTNLGAQRIEVEPLNYAARVSITLGLDFSPIHEAEGKCLWEARQKECRGNCAAILGETSQSGQKLLSALHFECNVTPAGRRDVSEGKLAATACEFDLAERQVLRIDRLVANQVQKDRAVSADDFWKAGRQRAEQSLATTYDDAWQRHAAYWAEFWRRFDLSIEGDPAYEQGARFCLFQLHSTYHGTDPHLNVGAKGLTGEQYGGLAFWDTEAYCISFYIFTDPAAARNLLMFRYHTLPQARERAVQLGCKGARYPFATIDGTEACGVWHHGDLEIHVPAAVAFGIWQYVTLTGDSEFLHRYGLEMLIEISRFYASHGNWGSESGDFGLWGVMGADEFHMMVHNNAYTNTMAKKTFEWTLDWIAEMQKADPKAWAALAKKVALGKQELADWRQMARKMRLQHDRKTGMIEQHDGYFDLPAPNPELVAAGKMSICKTQPYISRSRFNWIKQPDVLLLLFFFSHDYSLGEKRVNFNYYEPKCAHESSLSPGVHSILAAELGLHKMAFDYVRYASRLDLDDYNGNTKEGLHMTSMAAAWMSLVYGFGGLRSDGKLLSFNPSIPAEWKSFSFRIEYRGALLEIKVDRKQVAFRKLTGDAVQFEVFGTRKTLDDELVVPFPQNKALVRAGAGSKRKHAR